MALDALRCDHLAPLGFKGLKLYVCFQFLCKFDSTFGKLHSSLWQMIN